MKKIFIFLFSLLLFISIPSCKKKNKDIPKYNLIEKQFIIDETKEVKYPSMNDEIDQILLVNIKNTYDVLKDNYNSEVNITYESHLNDQYVSYIFHYYYLDNQIIKTYNFDLKTNRQIDFHTQPLIEKINQMLTNHYVLTEKDIGFLQSMIIDSKLHVYVSSIITNDTIQEVVFDMDRNLIAEDQNNENSKSKKIAITFDDGPSNKSKELVDLLEELDIVATFFILGCNASKYKEELKYIYAHGHEIGNHSYSHPDFKKITIEEGLAEIEKTQQIIYKTILHYPRVFRSPYGSVNKEILKRIDMPAILWNADSLDWQCFDSKIIIEKLKHEIKENGILLFHDFKYYNKEAITTIVNDLKQEGYVFVTISELFGFYTDEFAIGGKLYY